jgi:transcriptional regulator with XRE-family HTH domain
MKNKNETLVKANKIERPERLTLRKNREMFYEKFRTNLRILVGSTSVTAVQLAADMGLSSGARLTHLEYGRSSPEVEELTCIAAYFKVTIDDLLNKEAVITFK